MTDQTPDYVPPPRGSNTGVVIGVIVAVVLFLVVSCGLGLFGVGFMAFRTLEVQAPDQPQPPQPIELPQPVEVAPPAELPVEEARTPAPTNP